MVKLAVLTIALLVASAAATYEYKRAKVGEFVPPPAPKKESAHLTKHGIKAGERIPAPKNVVSLLETTESMGGYDDDKPAAKKGQAKGSNSAAKVPHNWFGTGKFTSPAYSVATGEQECDVCKAMIKAKRSEGKVDSKDQVGFCDGMNPSFKEMCTGYSKYLQECPSFVHNICHRDVGGAEELLSPCPEHLTCYYCLRINPIYCLA